MYALKNTFQRYIWSCRLNRKPENQRDWGTERTDRETDRETERDRQADRHKGRQWLRDSFFKSTKWPPRETDSTICQVHIEPNLWQTMEEQPRHDNVVCLVKWTTRKSRSPIGCRRPTARMRVPSSAVWVSGYTGPEVQHACKNCKRNCLDKLIKRSCVNRLMSSGCEIHARLSETRLAWTVGLL